MEVWTLIIQKSMVILPSQMVLSFTKTKIWLRIFLGVNFVLFTPHNRHHLCTSSSASRESSSGPAGSIRVRVGTWQREQLLFSFSNHSSFLLRILSSSSSYSFWSSSEHIVKQQMQFFTSFIVRQQQKGHIFVAISKELD